MKRELNIFLNPRTIAVIGASSNPEKVGYALMIKLSKFRGNVVPINPNHQEILGRKSFKSIKNYPKNIDLAVIAIPSEGVKKVLQDCAEKRIKNVIIISAGFSEAGKKELEEELIKIAKEHKMNLLGPNCFGIANPYLEIDTTFSNSSARKGNIAFISQSGALWSYIADISQSKKKFGFSGFVSLGNMADLDFSDFIDYFNKDKKTKKIILYIEKVKDGKRFLEVCKNSKKEIIAVKAGKSREGKQAAISHTGSLATDFEVYKGAFRQANVKIADSLASAFGIKKKVPAMKRGKIAIITNAGGAGALITDYLIEKKFDVEKPVDLIGTAQAEDYEKALNKLKDEYSQIVVIFTPQTMSQPEKTAEVLTNFKQKNKIIALFLGDKSIRNAVKILKKKKIKYSTDI